MPRRLERAQEIIDAAMPLGSDYAATRPLRLAFGMVAR